MSERNLLSGREKELKELADAYDASIRNGASFYADADDLADLADWFAMRRQYQKAMDVANHGLKIHPGNTSILIEMAYLYLDDGKLRLAEKIASHIEEDDRPEVILLRANLLIEHGQWEEADRLIDTIQDKDDLYNLIETAYLYIDAERFDKARPFIERGKELYATDPAFIPVLADYYAAQGEWQQAIECYNSLIDTNPYSSTFWHALAKAYIALHELGKAIDACDYALISEEDNGSIHLTKGMAYLELGNAAKANECFELAYRYDAIGEGFFLLRKAHGHMMLDQWEEAFSYFDQICKNPHLQQEIVLSTTYLEAAFCLIALHRDREEYDEYIEKALAIHDSCEDINLVFAAVMRLCEGRIDLARSYWKRALRFIDPTELWLQTADQCIQYGMVLFARDALNNLYNEDPHFEVIHERLASINLALGDVEEFNHFNPLCLHPLPAHEVEAIRLRLQTDFTPREAFYYAMNLYLPAEESPSLT